MSGEVQKVEWIPSRLAKREASCDWLLEGFATGELILKNIEDE